MSDMLTLSDADRYNNVLQMLIRCCVKVTKRLLSMFVSLLGYTCVDQFLSREKAHVLKMPSASLQKNQDILYPPSGTQTHIEKWDMSLLSCVFTHVQRKLLCYEIADPIDPVLIHYKLEVLATTVGQQYEDKLYPRSGKPTELNTWNMSLCSCLFSVLCPKPQTLYVRLAESLNSLREMRNNLCHSERLEMEHLVYEEHMPVLKEFISSGLTYIGDVAFETEIKEDMDDIEHGKMRSYVAIDHKHLQESYDSDRETSQRLDGLEKAVQQLTYQLQNDQGDKTLSMFFAKLKDDQRHLLYSSFADVFTQLVEKNAPEIVGEIHPDMKALLIHTICETWRIFDNPYDFLKLRESEKKKKCMKPQRLTRAQ
ncbi:uncharacterized protein LOC128238912 isoform X2 [Mya arenaria]|uniref:uncharacterized protein LOC128238912 isoform X2 n=1 Tax=Mya arenaria TaxID=6604 RepID=UPI0022E95B83|nr:uncharacterized protein LOC128238912 isoform X2 [Mya arenaria]